MAEERARGPGAGAFVLSGLRILYGLVLLATGLALSVGGARLIALGGSFYYLPAGIATVLAGVAVLRGRWRGGTAIFLALILATLPWALWEAGLNGWALAPRLLAPAVMGLPFLLAALASGERKRRRAGLALVGGAVLLVAAVAVGFRYEPAPERPALAAADPATESGDWPNYGNERGGNHFSPLSQITPANVGKLKIAWSTMLGPALRVPAGQNQATPLKVGDHLWTCLPLGYVYELDPETGEIRWSHDSQPNPEGLYKADCRGLAYHALSEKPGICAQRIYVTSSDARLIALDALTGRPCSDFGKDGTVDLLNGIRQRQRGYYFPTSGPTLVRGKLVVNAAVSDGQHVGEPSGVIRAYDAVTGKFAWAWDLGRPGERGEPPAGEHYTSGTPNSWSPMSADEELGLVFVPVGNATPDYWGGHRSEESNRFASSVVALDAETGELRWSFQTVHYDVWDYDVAAQPILFDLRTKSGTTPALMLPTKRGQLFILDRRTGDPLFPVVERPAPQRGSVERLSPTQPWSPEMADLGITRLVESDMWGITPLDQLWCRIKFLEARYDGPMTPPGPDYYIEAPGNLGGVGWGSASIDQRRQLAFMITNEMVNRSRLLPRAHPLAKGLKAAPTNQLGGLSPQEGTPYAVDFQFFFSPLFVPCQRPPFGKIHAVDLATGKLVWSRPLGTGRDFGPLGIASHIPFTMGIFNYGGALGTAGGLVFTGGTQDRTFRAFSAVTGELLFEADLPASAAATPMSYRSETSGRQFIVVSTEAPERRADGYYAMLTAFALPRDRPGQ